MADGTARAGAVCWLVQPVYLAIEVMVAARVSAPYSFLDNTISDLGAATCTDVEYPFGAVPVCSPWSALLNGAFVLFGLLLAGGAVLLRRRLFAGRAGTVAVVLWVISGLSSVGTGLVPVDRDLELHALVSLPALLAQPLALLSSGIALRTRRPALARSALGAGLVALVGAVVFVVRVDDPDLGGLYERLALWPAYLWVAAAASRGWRRPR